jgi:hypothetical protein
MNIYILIFSLFNEFGMSGYAESRPYLILDDTLTFNGYNRGWLEFKQDAAKFGSQIAFDCRMPYDTALVSLIDQISISRLSLWIGPENLRVTAGRQRLYWGVARVFSPLDILNPANYLEPGYERSGTNAILGYAAFGSMTSLRGIVVPKTNVKQSISGFRFGTNLFKNDLGLDVFHRQSSPMTMIGGEITGEAKIGYWSEFSYVFEDTSDYPKASIGVDYTFPFMLYCMLEFLHDGSGVSEPQEYDLSRILNGERSLLAQDYLYGSIGIAQNPVFRPSLSAVINLDDTGFILIPQVYYSIFDNTDLTLGSNIIGGSSLSEFRNLFSADAAFYIWARVYF